jgi:RimJ/RimL family protein N-acetyltransferase
MIDFGHMITLDTLNYPITPIIREWRNNYNIWKWCRQNDLISQDSHQKWSESLRDRSDVKMYAIKNNITVVGVCGLTDIDRINQRAEFSLYINSDHQGQGYGKSALKTLIAHGFMSQNLNVIWGETFEGNPAYDMFLKLGMKHEGTRRQFYYKEGNFIDAHLVSITKQEYREQNWIKTQCLEP